MILMFTDFGADGPYLGQMQAVLRLAAPGVDAINLCSDAAPGEPRLASYLLAALAPRFPAGSVFLCVVDPGVGGERLPAALKADGRWFAGPDNGLLNTVAAQAESASWHAITWRPEAMSASFHGRDLFAPVAARLALGDCAGLDAWAGPDLQAWPADCACIVYFDRYGNAVSGRRYDEKLAGKTLRVKDHRIPQARTFCEQAAGAPFWYRNSMDLVEIAVNRGRADAALGLGLGEDFCFEEAS